MNRIAVWSAIVALLLSFTWAIARRLTRGGRHTHHAQSEQPQTQLDRIETALNRATRQLEALAIPLDDQDDSAPGFRQLAETLSQDIDRFRGQTSRLQSESEQLGSDARAVQSNTTQLKSHVNVFAGQIEALEAYGRAFAAKINDLETQRSTVQELDVRLQELIESLLTRTGALEGRQREIDQNSEAIHAHARTIASDVREVRQYLRTLNDLHTSLHHAPALVQQGLEDLAGLSSRLQEQEDLLATKLLEAEERQSVLEEQRQQLAAGTLELFDQARVYRATRDELKSEVQGESREIERLKLNQEKITEELRTERFQRNELEVEQRKLKAENKRLRQRLGNAAEEETRASDPARQFTITTEGLLSEAEQQNEHWSSAELPTSFEELVIWAKAAFPSVQIAESALQESAALNSAADKERWIEDTWKALGALHQYSTTEHSFTGDFYRWCRDSGDQFVWYPDRVAMQESDTTMAKYGHKRVFDIDTQVVSDGRIEMQAHIQIQKGGGQHIPRLFFFDDTNGVTGQVHVGFVGPHRLVPNFSGR